MENIIVSYHNYSMFVDDTIFMSGFELLVSDEMFLLYMEGQLILSAASCTVNSP